MKKQAVFGCIAAVAFSLAGQASAARPLKSVGVAVSDLANPYFVAIGKGASDAARKVGGDKVKVTTVSSKYDLNTQVGQIENFIANKVDILIVNASDPKGIAPVLQKARNAGIVVMAVDVGADNADATIMSDNTMAGVESCRRIDAVFAINDPSAIGAELAVKQAGRADVQMVASVDGAPDAEAALKSKNSIFAVTTAQDPYKMATMAVDIGYGIMNGKRPANPVVLIPTPAITKDNVAAYQGWASHK